MGYYCYKKETASVTITKQKKKAQSRNTAKSKQNLELFDLISVEKEKRPSV